VHWSGIRAHRLSSHHGEFCKLFCSQTSREVDFFSEDGARNSEQLLNMIGMCTSFSFSNQPLLIGIQNESPSKKFTCTVHSSPPVTFHVVASARNPIPASEQSPISLKTSPVKLWILSTNEDGSCSLDESHIVADVDVTFVDAGFGLPSNIYANFRYQSTCIQAGSFQLLRPGFRSFFDKIDSKNEEAFKSALEKVKQGAVGQPVSKASTCPPSIQPGDHDEKVPGVTDFRNFLAHSMLTFDVQRFDNLVACARSIFAGLSEILSIIGEDSQPAKRSLAEIESIVERDIQIATCSEDECEVLKRYQEQFLEERERLDRLKVKLARKFDSFAPCLMKDIQDQFVAGALEFF
jgi:hypothetical protein